MWFDEILKQKEDTWRIAPIVGIECTHRRQQDPFPLEVLQKVYT